MSATTASDSTSISEWAAALEGLRGESGRMGDRMRAVFHLRTDGSDAAREVLCRALEHKADSSLLRHELAYVLGQMQLTSSVPTLTRVLEDAEDCPVVRHEAAEALGAIADPSSLAVLEKFCDDERPEVSETCAIAVRRLRWLADHPEQASGKNGEGNGDVLAQAEASLFESVDPAPAALKDEVQDQSVVNLGAVLMNADLQLFRRYQAMFSLRNLAAKGTEEAVVELAKGLKDDSALFRHEVAYVLGQLEEAAAPAVRELEEALRDENEHGMVRHEAAEALGAVGTPECIALLKEYLNDPEPLVSESCETALDSIDYWTKFAEGAKEEEEEAEA